MIFATFDADGLPTGFYPKDVFAEPPPGAVQISSDDWRDFIDNSGLRKWDGKKVVPFAPPAPPPSPPVVSPELHLAEVLIAEGIISAAKAQRVRDRLAPAQPSLKPVGRAIAPKSRKKRS